MKLIVATNNLGVIGKDGSIPWRCKADMQHFKKLTTEVKYSAVVMGGSTWRSLGKKPLPDRNNVVLTREEMPNMPNSGLVFSNSLYEVVGQLWLAERQGDIPVWVIGGKTVYDQLIQFCDEVHWSHINDDTPGDTTWWLPDDYKGKVFHYYFDTDGARGTSKTIEQT